MIHNPQHYARDFYFFKRSQYPQLSLTHKKPQAAYNELQAQCFGLKFVEMGKVMLTWGILKNVNQVVQRVVFLHEVRRSRCRCVYRNLLEIKVNHSMQDLIKLPSFPRKALEADLDLYHNGQMGKVGRQSIAHKGENSLVSSESTIRSGRGGRYLYVLKSRVSAGLRCIYSEWALTKSPLWLWAMAAAEEEVSVCGLPLLKGR